MNTMTSPAPSLWVGWVLPISSKMTVRALNEAEAAAKIARQFFPHRTWKVLKQNGNWQLYTRTRKGEVYTKTFIHVEAAS